MRKLASIQKIIKIEPIPGADRIEKATILGWECVVQKGQFKPGDHCIYFEIDSIVPQMVHHLNSYVTVIYPYQTHTEREILKNCHRTLPSYHHTHFSYSSPQGGGWVTSKENSQEHEICVHERKLQEPEPYMSSL